MPFQNVDVEVGLGGFNCVVAVFACARLEGWGDGSGCGVCLLSMGRYSHIYLTISYQINFLKITEYQLSLCNNVKTRVLYQNLSWHDCCVRQ